MLFKFFAKQGQENQVVVLLKKFGNPRIDKKPEGVLVSVDLPDGVSKRSVNKMLFQNHVVGSQSKKNRFRVLRISRWDKWTMPRKKLRKSPHSSRPAGVVVDAQKLLWNQEGAILDTTELICSLMKEAGVTRSELAARMGKTKGNISQMLSGDRNLTIRTVSDLMTYLGDEYRG